MLRIVYFVATILCVALVANALFIQIPEDYRKSVERKGRPSEWPMPYQRDIRSTPEHVEKKEDKSAYEHSHEEIGFHIWNGDDDYYDSYYEDDHEIPEKKVECKSELATEKTQTPIAVTTPEPETTSLDESSVTTVTEAKPSESSTTTLENRGFEPQFIGRGSFIQKDTENQVHYKSHY